MLPTRPQTLRTVQAFDLITPDDQVYRFPRQTWLQRVVRLLYSYAEPAIVSAVVLTLVYSAGALAELIEPLSSDTCRN
jgi:hypothetical protein